MNKIIGVVMLWGILTLIGGVCELAYWSGSGIDAPSHLQVLVTAPKFGIGVDTVSNPWELGAFTWTWLENLGDMLFFKYPFFQNEWVIVKYIFFMPIGVGIIWALVNLFRGTTTS